MCTVAGGLPAYRAVRRQARTQPDAAALRRFEVVCQRSGITLEVEAGDSILGGRSGGGSDHRQFMRGSAEAARPKCWKASPEHLDSVLKAPDKEAGDMILCVSRSRTPRLVLDL